MFKGKGNPKYNDIRALFPIPSLTMHFVLSKKSGVKKFSDLKGKTILLGKGSFGAKEGAKYLKLFGIKDNVKLANVEISNAVPALKNGQIDGFVTAGSWPAPNVIEAAAGTGVHVISLTSDQVKKTKRTKLVIPAGTYKGQTSPITTTSLPVVAYSTTRMDAPTAYALTKTYWTEKGNMGQKANWWNGVDKALMANIIGKIHPGALKYYRESGFNITESQK
jgi:TRAP transporter TAXI family solute receptor